MSSQVHESIRQHIAPLDSVKLMARNTNTHPRENLDDIKVSLEKFGQDQVLVANQRTKELIKGNGRWLAMKELGWTEAAIIFVDEDELKSKARSIADNRASELSERDWDVLLEELKEIQNNDNDLFEGTGYSNKELDELIASMETDEKEVESVDEWTERTFILTNDQASIVDAALDKIKRELSGANVDGRALEFMAADYLGR